MTTSPEYPDLLWVPPRSYTSGRYAGQPTKIVIHATDNTANATAEASYGQNRADGTSTHYFVDSTQTIQCVRTTDMAHAALLHGNQDGIQYELCGRSGFNWPDALLRRAAKQIARDCRRYSIPVRRLVGSQVRDRGARGICGHVDMTNGWPEDHGSHTDPGANFPWVTLLTYIGQELGGVDLTPEEHNMLAAIHSLLWAGDPAHASDSSRSPWWLVRAHADTQARVAASRELLMAAIAGIPTSPVPDPQVIAEAIAAKLGPTLAGQVADVLSARLKD